jgi:hypothetical protein
MNNLAVAISIILLPGLVASVICDKITVHSPRWDTFKYSIYSFLFGVLSYGLLQFIDYANFLILGLFDKTQVTQFTVLKVWSIIQDDKAKIAFSEIFQATLLAPVVALIASFLVNYKIINKIAKKIRVSQKYGDENLFSFFLNAKEVDWVYVRDPGVGLTYFGRVVSHSECDSMQEIVLSEVTVHEYETSAELYSIPIIYLSKPLGSFVIEVPAPAEEENKNGKETN